MSEFECFIRRIIFAYLLPPPMPVLQRACVCEEGMIEAVPSEAVVSCLVCSKRVACVEMVEKYFDATDSQIGPFCSWKCADTVNTQNDLGTIIFGSEGRLKWALDALKRRLSSDVIGQHHWRFDGAETVETDKDGEVRRFHTNNTLTITEE